VGSLRVATTQAFAYRDVYVQYGRSTNSLEATINRLWLFLLGGVLGGTLLAALAGIAIARRAMRPVSTLTTRAREIASTRDPSLRIPDPETDDEVGELARTLDQMLRELDAARSETEQMMQAQREFVADASHELRTPLTSILANLELLQERVETTERRGEDGEMIASALSSARRMSRLVSDLLLLARADAGRTGSRRECDLAAVAAAALSEVRPVADGHRLTLAEHGPVPVKGNPDELHRLAVNLLDNGLRHTPAGTEIRIAVERRNGDAVLEVSDDGPGIPAGMEKQVFSRFVRGDGPADAAGDTGTGLGLAIVKAVALSHHGDVDAGSSPAGGARFTVRLPLPTP
jgi:signal transduction histidine kinase